MENTRYSRLQRYAGYAGTLSKWQATTAAVVGLGGLGSGLVMHLARMGLKRIVLIDRDIVGEENLGHQLLYTQEDARQGLPKAVAAKHYVRQVNPGVETSSFTDSLTRHSVAELLACADCIFDGLDNYYTRMLINDFAVKSNLPYFYAGVVRGELSAKAVIPGHTSCLRCVLPTLPAPGDVPTCASEGVFPPLLGVANALQLNLANNWLAGVQAEDILYSMSTRDWRLHKLTLPRPDPACPACGMQRFDYLDGLIDPSAAGACHGERFEADIPGEDADLQKIANQLEGAGGFEIKRNKFCLVAVKAKVRYTLFASGKLIMEGAEDSKLLDSFVATYLGV